ncbi:MAG: hypothetical protein RL727_622, partial [Pseudomonadota bacterium]
NEKALARLLYRAETDQLFYKKLQDQIKQLRKLIKPVQEKAAIQKLCAKLFQSTRSNK